MKYAFSSVILAVPFVAATGTAHAELPFRTVAQALEGDVDPVTSAVVSISDWGGPFNCSGTLIAPNLVLTARHCVAESSSSRGIDCEGTTFLEPAPASTWGISTTTRIDETAFFHQGREVHVPADAVGFCGNDIALIILEGTVPATEATSIVPRIDQRVKRGDRYSAVGFGNNGWDEWTGWGEHGTRRRLDGLVVPCSGSFCAADRGMTNREFSGEGAVCPGDSGGPAIDELGRVIGVASRAYRPCIGPVYTSVEPWGDWIVEVGRRAAELGQYEPPAWVRTGSGLPDNDGDGIDDLNDNCVATANSDQLDGDADGTGDACEPPPPEDRGGTCEVCNECYNSADCGEGYSCVDFGGTSICTIDCSEQECPANSVCVEVVGPAEASGFRCVNDTHAVAFCEADWVCGSQQDDGPAGCSAVRPARSSTISLLCGIVVLCLARWRSGRR